jgi:uncharacterized metal-binding protein YceD (DUF177 family)
MKELLKIFTDQLQEGETETIDLTLPPEFLDLSEKDIQTPSPILVKGEAYVVDDLLIFSLSIQTEIEMLCSICNGMTRVSLENKNIDLSLSLSELPSSIFDYSDLLREEIIMLIPQFAECSEGSCPKRKELKNHLKQDPHYFPFKNL